MAYYLVRAHPKPDLLDELAEKLRQGAFTSLRPFGESLSQGLNGARWEAPGMAIWEEEDYCVPPLAQERAAVLDTYFKSLSVEKVQQGKGWSQIESLALLWNKSNGGTNAV